MTKIYTHVEYQWNDKKQIYEKTYAEFENYEGIVAQCFGGGGGDGDTRMEMRYANYIEVKHSAFLDLVATSRAAIIDDSPFTDYETIPVDVAFFGTGFILSSFPSQYDMFGKFMAGLDIDVLWSQNFEDTVNAPVVNDLVAAQSEMMDDDIESNSLPRLQLGMRDMNAVLSSSYVIGKSIIEDAREKSINLFSANLKYGLIPVANSRWNTHLEWNHRVIGVYAELLKFYFSAKTDVDDINYAMATKERLWPFTVLDYERAALGTMQGAMNQKTDVAGASMTSKVISASLSGAAMGAQIGSIWNTPATYNSAGEMTQAASNKGSGWGSVIGATLATAAALTY